MKIFKKVVPLVLCLSMFAGSSIFAQSSVSEPEAIKTEQEIIIDNKLVATKYIETIYTTDVIDGDTVIILNNDVHYKFTEETTEVQKELLQDEKTTTTLEQTKEGDIIIDGVQLSEEEANRPLNSRQAYEEGNSFALAATTDRGGYPAICHYYGDYKIYTYGCYDSISYTFSASGSNYSAVGIKVNNAYSSRAQGSIDLFKSHYDSLNWSLHQFSLAFGATALSLSTVISAIAALPAGAAAVYSAVQVVNDYNTVNSDLKKATGYIQQMK